MSSDESVVDGPNAELDSGDDSNTRLPLRSASHSQIIHNAIKDSASSFNLSSLTVDGPSSIDKKIFQMRMEDELLAQIPHLKVFHLRDVLPMIAEGATVIVEDDFHKCFESNFPEPWNWNSYLFVLWSLGVFWRYCVLFPIRLISLLIGCLLCFASFFIGSQFVRNPQKWKRGCIRFLASVFVFSWTGVIRYHGVTAKRRVNQIYVANHTSMIDVIVLMQNDIYAVVGQQHKTWVAWFQNVFLGCLGCIWFNRGEAKDRQATAQRIKQHIHDPNSNRLLIFPEGTCVNNEFAVLFKKGAFDLGAEVCPIAIKYNKQFVDAFWNSARPFHWHLFDLMTSWALVCDVWYLQPQRQLEGESSIEFANRVKMMIADRAGLKSVSWDGLMKHWTGPSARFLCKRQKLIADSLLERERLSILPQPEEVKAAVSHVRRRVPNGIEQAQ